MSHGSRENFDAYSGDLVRIPLRDFATLGSGQVVAFQRLRISRLFRAAHCVYEVGASAATFFGGRFSHFSTLKSLEAHIFLKN